MPTLLTDQACDPTTHADLAAIVMQEGLAHVCLVTSSMTIVRAKIETYIPKKRKGFCSQHDKVSIMYCSTLVYCIVPCIFLWQEYLISRNYIF